MISGYFVWWYGTGLTEAYAAAMAAMTRIVYLFSVSQLGKTLFDPWKNDVIRAHNLSLADQLKVWQLNLASRIVGFLVRSLVILAALFVLALLILLSAVILFIWIATPLLAIVLPLIGVTRLFV